MYTESELYTAKHFGITFYEHPEHGEETPMLVKRGRAFYETELYDAPCSKEDASEQYAEAVKTDPVLRVLEGGGLVEGKLDDLDSARRIVKEALPQIKSLQKTINDTGVYQGSDIAGKTLDDASKKLDDVAALLRYFDHITKPTDEPSEA